MSQSGTASSPPTPRQLEVHAFMLGYQATHGMPPSYREIMGRFGFRSPQGVTCHIKAMAKKGLVRLNGKALSRSAVALTPVDPAAPCCPTCGRSNPETRGAHA